LKHPSPSFYRDSVRIAPHPLSKAQPMKMEPCRIGDRRFVLRVVDEEVLQMNAAAKAAPNTDRELVLTRLIDAPREKLFRAWTEPELLKRWFAPKPWTITRAEIDLRPGGASLIVMRSPEGEEFPNPGVVLEVVKNERIVMTDAYTKAWEPSGKPFMTAIVTFEDEGGKTRYTARARHWTVADREGHEKMGFHEGWGQCADQLAELAKKI
jgi:uncharacterized protein YndB with AHSA1/START domain